MNNNIKIKLSKLAGLLSLCLVLNSSCNKFLDVRPVGEIPSEQMLESAEGFESAMYGVYGSMATSNLYGRTLSHQLVDVLAQYFNVVGDANEFVINAKKYNYLHSDVEEVTESVWLSMYKNIANVNNILINLEKKDPSSMRYYNLYKGEALGLRAFMHFDLVRLYTANITNNPGASGIPYSIKFELSPSAFSTAAKVYDLIIADLLDAEELLAKDADYFTFPKVNPSESFLRDREIHFNLYAVQATLARVYLTKGDKVNAAKYAKKVLDANKFKLIEQNDFSTDLPKGMLYPTETIFGLYNIKHFEAVKQRFYDSQSFFSYNLRSDLEATYQLEQNPIDYRIGRYFEDRLLGSSYVKRFVKLLDPYQLRDQEYLRPKEYVTGINLIRLPEMYYILAEALLETDPAAAMRYFNDAIKSRGLAGLSERQPALPLTLDRITVERYKELIGEGQTFFNMKRLNLAIKNTDGVTIPASNQVYVWPIPNDEIEYNF